MVKRKNLKNKKSPLKIRFSLSELKDKRFSCEFLSLLTHFKIYKKKKIIIKLFKVKYVETAQHCRLSFFTFWFLKRFLIYRKMIK